MHLAPGKTVLAVALAALAFALAACSSPQPAAVPTPTSTPAATVETSSVEPTTAAPEAPVASSGPIITPASGTALRAAILKAAAAGLGFSGKLTVIQLFSQDTVALGDLKPTSGSRTFFALTGGPDEWKLAWSAPYGSALANLDALTATVPEASPALAAKLVWNKKAPVTTTTTVKAPTLASFEAYALKSATSMAGASYTGTFTVTAAIAKDSKGVWWGNALASPSDGSLEDIGVWGKYSGTKWTGQVADFSNSDAPASFFPADVLEKLSL
jgi:hypothetical protein